MKNLATQVRLLVASVLPLALLGGALMASPVYAAGNTCTYIGAYNGSWSTAGNWSGCGGVAPQNGDSLVFDSTSYNTNPPDVINDIANLQLNSVTFTGTGSFPFDISGNSLSLSGGITDTSFTGAAVFNNLTLTASQTFSSSGLLDIDGTTLTTGTNTLHVVGTSGGEVDITSAITGAGAINFDNDTGSNFLDHNNPSFSGPLNINTGRLIINASHTDQLGTGAVTIASGASLQESINSNGTYTLANAITLGGGGTGSTGVIDVHGFSASGTVNLTGAVTLTSNATVSLESADVNFNGAVSGCGFSIALKSGSSGTLGGNLTGSCPANGGAGSGSSGSSSATSADPAAPSTGYGKPASDSGMIIVVLSVAVVAAGVALRLLPWRQAD